MEVDLDRFTQEIHCHVDATETEIRNKRNQYCEAAYNHWINNGKPSTVTQITLDGVLHSYIVRKIDEKIISIEFIENNEIVLKPVIKSLE